MADREREEKAKGCSLEAADGVDLGRQVRKPRHQRVLRLLGCVIAELEADDVAQRTAGRGQRRGVVRLLEQQAPGAQSSAAFLGGVQAVGRTGARNSVETPPGGKTAPCCSASRSLNAMSAGSAWSLRPTLSC